MGLFGRLLEQGTLYHVPWCPRALRSNASKQRGETMRSFILALAVTVLSLAPVSAQVKPGTGSNSNQSKDLAGVNGQLGDGRARVLGTRRPDENKTEGSLASPSSAAYAASRDNSSPLNATST